MMTLKNGKFFKDGEPYPLEFGNKEQIKLINEVEFLKEEGTEARLTLSDMCNPDSFFIICVCGAEVVVDCSNPDIACNPDGIRKKCPKCKFKYELVTDDNDTLLFKLIN